MNCYLVLEDGTIYSGKSFGAAVLAGGELVFQTGMVGYPEAMTDNSYTAQILVLTYPLIGNYGCPDDNLLDNYGLSKYFERLDCGISVAALVVSEICSHPSHWQSVSTLSDWMKKHGVPGISGIDTRSLTKKIRTTGSTLARIRYEHPDKVGETLTFMNPNSRNLVAECSIKEPKIFNEKGHPKICVIDCGMKLNQIRCFIQRGARIQVVPWNYQINRLDFDGLFISNGPGDPQMCQETILELQQFLIRPDNQRKPIFGICLGHQLLSTAIGCKTFKMKYGNRGHNLPCIHNATGRCFMTSQNHGYAVDINTLPSDWEPLFTNLNDQTNEGKYRYSEIRNCVLFLKYIMVF